MRFRRTTAVLAAAALSLTTAPASGEASPARAYVVNSGRDFNGNTGPSNIAIFTVRADGGLDPFGTPVPTGLGARALKFSGDVAYLVATEENALYAYTVTPTGGLTLLARVDVGGSRPFGLAVAPDGRSLYTANIGSDNVSVFRADRYGVPVFAGTVPTGQNLTRNVLTSRDGRFLFVTHGLPNSAGPDPLVVFPILTGGTLGPPRMPIPIGGGGTGMTTTPDGRFLYIACSGTNDVYAFRISHDGTLTSVPGQPFPAPRTPESMAVTPDGSRLHVTSVASQPTPDPVEAGVWTFTIDDNGTLATDGPRTGSFLGPGIATSPDGDHLYTGDFFRNTVSAFDITTGVPKEIADSPYPSRGLAPGFDGVAVR